MKNLHKKIISSILCAVMLFGTAPLNGIAEIDFSKLNMFSGLHLSELRMPVFDSPFETKASAEDAIYSGECGRDVTWSFDETDGTLTIGGEGRMRDFYEAGSAPWSEFSESIETVDVQSGVTGIGSYAFSGCAAKTVNIPATVNYVGKRAFKDCMYLETVNWNAVELPGLDFRSDLFGNVGRNSENGVTVIFGEDVRVIPDYIFLTCDYNEVANNAIKEQLGNYSGMITLQYSPEFTSNVGFNLKSVEIPGSVEIIGDRAFFGCSELERVAYGAEQAVCNMPNPDPSSANPYTKEEANTLLPSSFSGFDFSSFVNSSIDTALAAESPFSGAGYCLNGDGTTVIFGNGVQRIPTGLFKAGNNPPEIGSFYFSESISDVEPDAFYGITDASKHAPVSWYARINNFGIANPVHVHDGNDFLTDGNWSDDSDSLFTYKPNEDAESLTVTGLKPGAESFPAILIIPSEIGGLPVTAIGDNAFSDAFRNGNYYGGDGFIPGLEGVIISEGVELIGEGAFAGMPILSADLPESLGDIRDGAFSHCKKLKNYALPGSLGYLGAHAFENTAIENVVIPGMVRYIGDYAFSCCANLETVTISGELWSIGENAFSNCKKLKACALPEGLVYLGAHAFEDTAIENVVIPGTVRDIRDYAFSGCASLKTVTISEGVVSIGEKAFSGCTKTESIVISGTVTSISLTAFTGCYGIESLAVAETNPVFRSEGNCIIRKSDNMLLRGCKASEIPEGVVSIGELAFAGAVENDGPPASFMLPYSVTSIGRAAFDGCGFVALNTFRSSLSVGNDNTNVHLYRIYYKTILLTITITGCDSGITGKIVIPDKIEGRNVTKIADEAFKGCTNLEAVSLPSTLTSIGEAAFADCKGLKEVFYDAVDAGTTVNYFLFIFGHQNSPFYNAGVKGDGLDLTFGDSVEKIPQYLFAEAKIKSVHFGKSVKQIPAGAFTGCTGIESIEVDAENTVFRSEGNCLIKDIKSPLFHFFKSTLVMGCKNSVIPDDVQIIGDSAFYGCAGLESITIPSGVTSIGKSAFKNCADLESIDIHEGVGTIYGSTFSGCTSLAEITLPDSLRKIEANAFSGTAYYNDGGNWENGVLYIGNHLIKANADITGDYAIKGNTVCVADSAFSGCTGLTNIIIPDGVKAIGTNAFYNVFNVKTPENLAVSGSPWGARSVNGYIEGCLVYNNETKTELRACATSAGETVVIPASVEKVADRAFMNCAGIKKVIVKVRGSEPEWGKDVFIGCTSLEKVQYLFGSGQITGDIIFGDNGRRLIFCNKDRKEAYTVPDAVTVIEDNAFYNCTQIPSITLNGNLISIGAHAFEGTELYNNTARDESGALYLGENGRYLIDVKNSSLEEYSIREGTAVIAAGAFEKCGGLKNVTLPSALTGIGHDAFNKCVKLEKINDENCDGIRFAGRSVLPDNYINNVAGPVYIGSALIKYAPEIPEEPENPEDPETPDETKANVKDGTTCIAEEAFAGRTEIQSVNLPDGLKAIGSSAFDGCTGLSQINIPQSVTDIGGYAFRNCAITEAHIPANIENIGENAFYGCKALASFTGGNGIYSTAGGVLTEKREDGKPELIQYPPAKEGTEYSVTDSVGRIANFAFSFCDNLDNIRISSAVKYKSLAFSDCPAVRVTDKLVNGIELSDDGKVLVQVTSDALVNGEFTVPESVIMIAPNSFNSIKEELKSIDLNNTSIINPGVFDGCENLESVSGTDNLVWVGENAFTGCAKLEEIALPKGAVFTSSCFDESTNVKSDGEFALSIVSDRTDPLIPYGEEITLSADFEGELKDDQKIVWIYSDTGEKITENAESISIKAEAIRKVQAMLVMDSPVEDDDDLVLAKSNEVTLTVVFDPDSIEVHEMVDASGSPAENTTVKLNREAVFSIKGWNPDWNETYIIEWYVDGAKAVSDSADQSRCTVKNKEKNFTIEARISNKEYPNVLTKSIGPYTINVESLNSAIKTGNSRTVDYRSKVTVFAQADNIPEEYCLAIYEGGNLIVKGDNKSVSYDAGEMTANRTFTIRVIDEREYVLKDTAGNLLQRNVEVKVKTGFFDKIIAFFRGLFGLLPKVEIKP